MKELYRKFYNEENWNACIALLLGWNFDGLTVKSLSGSDLEYKYVMPNGEGTNKLPQWDADNNLWVDGSKVVEWMRKETLVSLFTATLTSQLRSEDLFTTAADYAETLAMLGLERTK